MFISGAVDPAMFAESDVIVGEEAFERAGSEFNFASQVGGIVSRRLLGVEEEVLGGGTLSAFAFAQRGQNPLVGRACVEDCSDLLGRIARVESAHVIVVVVVGEIDVHLFFAPSLREKFEVFVAK